MREERGAILPIAAAAIVLAMVVLALVLDIANWYQHGKTLQIRADAAVLAGGQRWAFPCEPSTDALIEATARDYVGSHMRHPPSAGALETRPYNNLITTTSPSDVHVVFNSLQYFENGGSDWTDRVDPSVELTGKPCTRDYLDAKITEEDISGFFGRFANFSFLPSLSRKARVGPKEVESLEGLLPIGVKAFDVRSGAVLFVSEATGAQNGVPLAKKYLARDPDDSADGDGTPDFPGFVRWSNEADPSVDAEGSPAVDVPMSEQGVGAVIVLSSRPRNAPCGPTPCFSLLGPTATASDICNQGDTQCFDATASGTPPVQAVRGGLSFIAGYNPTPGSPTVTEPPNLGDVYLQPVATGCRSGYFVYGDAPCTIELVADIRFANGPLPGARPDGEVVFTAHDALDWCPNNGCVLTKVSGTTWATTITTTALAVTATAGQNAFKLRWRFGEGTVGATTCANNPGAGGNNCDGGFDLTGVGFVGNFESGEPVHRSFTSNEALSGPIEVMRVWNAEAAPVVDGSYPTSGAGSLPDLFVDIYLSNVVSTAPGDPPIALRLVGSQNGSIDCDPSVTFDEEFLEGCNVRYTSNDFSSNPPCPDYNDQWDPLSGPPPIPALECVITQTGNFLGEFTKGVEDRVNGGGNTCRPDNDASPGNYRAGWNWWNNAPNPDPTQPPIPLIDPVTGTMNPNGTMFPNFEPTDPRLVSLFITPFGAFQGSGNAIFPITGFGAFYITGWNGTGASDDDCPGFDTAPQAGFLVGHFIKDVIITGAEPSQKPCNPASLDPCVVALIE